MSLHNLEENIELEKVNEQLRRLGMLEVMLISPFDCIPQRVNARYFTMEKMQTMIDNIKRTKALESVPLVYQDDELRQRGKVEIISGHHRVEAAKAAQLKLIMVMVERGLSREELVSKQLAHNALVGEDDKGILKLLFDSIQNIDLKLASGLSDEIEKIKYDSLNFRIGQFRSFMIAFIPDDLEDYDKAVEEFMENSVISGDTELRIASSTSYDDFAEAIMKIKKLEKVKSNAVALHRMTQIALEVLRAREKEKEVFIENLNGNGIGGTAN